MDEKSDVQVGGPDAEHACPGPHLVVDGEDRHTLPEPVAPAVAAEAVGAAEEVAQRVAAGELRPDYGPAGLSPQSGAVLVTARPPLVAFNVDLATDDVDLARAIAADLRESGGGRPGVRAIGLALPHRNRAQVSLNIHDHRVAPLAEIVAEISSRASIAELELVGLAPAAALEGLPDDVPMRAFDPDRHVIENALRSFDP